MICLNRKTIFLSCVIWLTGCSAGFLGLAPLNDRKEYVQARDAYADGNYQAAISQLTDYIYKTKNVARREARAYRLLGRSYEQIEKPDRALEIYSEALEFHPENVPLLLEAGRLYQENGLTTRSIEMYERALTEEPNNTEALAGQAVNYTTLGFYSKARRFYNDFFALSGAVSPLYRARYASTFLRERNYEQAFIHITLALEQDPTNADFWRISAEARRGMHQLPQALADLKTAILLAPERTDFLTQKALWLYEAGRYQASLQIIQKILNRHPGNALAQLVQALNWQKQGKTAAARKQFAQIAHELQTQPNSFVGQVAKQLAQEK